MTIGEPKKQVPSVVPPAEATQERVVAAFKNDLQQRLPEVMDDIFADIDAAVAEAEGEKNPQSRNPDDIGDAHKQEAIQAASPLSSKDTLEQAEEWWANAGKGRELAERVDAIRASLNRFDMLIAQIRRFPQGEELLSKALEAEHPRVRPLTTDRVNAQLRDVLDQIETGNLSRFQPKDGETNGRKPEQKRDAYLKANFLGHHVVLLAAEKVLKELRDSADAAFPTQVAEAKALVDEWFELHKKIDKRRNVDGIHRAVRSQLGIRGPLPDLEGWKSWIERHEQGAWAEGKGSRLKQELREEKLPKLRVLLTALRAELSATDRKRPSATDDRDPGERQRTPFPEKLARIQTLAVEWEALHQKVPKSRYGDFHVAINDALTLKQGLIIVPEFLAWLKEREEKHHWKGPESSNDKVLVDKRLFVLELMVAKAKEKLPEFEEKPEDKQDATTPTPATASSSPSAASAVTPASDPRVDPSVPLSRPTDLGVMPERRFKSLRNSLQVEKHLENIRSDEEVRYRDKEGNLYIVRPTRNRDFFDLWYPDKVKRGKHVRDLASELYQLGVAFEDKGVQADKIENLEYDPTLRELTADEAKSRVENAQGAVRREILDARSQLERDLNSKIGLFAQAMDAKLRQVDPTLSFAKRRGRILQQLPEFAQMVIERLGQKAALSDDEREDMIERHTRSVEIPK